MANSDSELDFDVEEQAKALTTCSICLDRFICPKVLPCQHTFCLVCLRRCHDSVNSQRLVPVSNFPCPTCRKVCFVPQGGLEQLTTDFKVGQILDLMAAIENSMQFQQKSTVPGFGRCSICCFQKREKPAGSFCLQCEKAFCDQCLSHHAKTKIFGDHVVIKDDQTCEPRQNSDKCLDHDAKFKYYCEDCISLLCTVCLFSEHGDHSILEIEKAADLLDTELIKFADDLSRQMSMLNDGKMKINGLKEALSKRKESFELAVCSAYEEALKTLEDSKTQLLSEGITVYNNMMGELKTLENMIDGGCSNYQDHHNSVTTCRNHKGSCKFFSDFDNVKRTLANLQHPKLEIPSFEKIEFVPAPSISLGAIGRIEKACDPTVGGVESFARESGKKKQQEDKENQEASKKNIPTVSYGKPFRITKLQVSVQNSVQDKTAKGRDQPKPGSSDRVIQGLGRRLSGRLSAANFQQANQVGASAPSPTKRKTNWIAEGFSQCRDCCFMRTQHHQQQQWFVAACDYRATSAGDRIKIFDLKGRQQSTINVRTVVEPWSLVYLESSHAFLVTDHSSRAVKMIHLDETGRCSKVSTLYQSYADKPSGICQTSPGKFVVSDVGSRHHRLGVYAMNQNFLDRRTTFGKKGSADGEILLANFVASDGTGRAIVSDSEGNCIKVFSPDGGAQLLKFSCSCSFEGGKELEPQGVAADDSGNILVADQATNAVLMFCSEGQLIGNVVSCKGKPWGIAYADELRMLAVATDKGLEVFEL